MACQAGGTASYSFDVANMSDSAVRVGVEPLFENKQWIKFTNDEHAELALPAKGLQRVSFKIVVPATAQPKRYSFKVRVYDLRTPMLANESSAVQLDVKVAPSTGDAVVQVPPVPDVENTGGMNRRRVFIAMSVGGVVLFGAVIGLWLTGGDAEAPVTPPQSYFVERGRNWEATGESPGLIIADEITVSGIVRFPADTFWVANSIVFDDGARVVAAPGVPLRLAAVRFVNLQASANGADAPGRGGDGGNGGNVLLVGLELDGARVSAKGGNGAQGIDGNAGSPGSPADCTPPVRPGERGGDGGTGGAGGNGGSGGSITVYSGTALPDGSFDAQGGAGATGGQGGPAGKGGARRRCDLGLIKFTQPGGPDGAPGAQGTAGINGMPGQIRSRMVDRSTIENAVRSALDLRPPTATEFERALGLQL